MKILVIGLGSMGKRRIRCLKALGESEIVGFDTRIDRREEATTKYNVTCYDDFQNALEEYNPDAFIISVPNNWHRTTH